MQILFTIAPLFVMHSVWAPSSPRAREPKNIIVDTDFLSFPDDVGAVALANAFEQLGKARILGIASDVNSRYVIPAIDAINTYYGHPDILFAQDRSVTNQTAEPDTDPASDPVFITTLANYTLFPEDVHDGSNKTVFTPLEFYHDILSKAEDKSITILGLGFLNNLNALYHSQDGKELIERKVAEFVVEGGDFGPNELGPAAGPNSAGYNLVNNLTAAKVLEVWPTPVTFLGDNIGRSVFTGAVLKDTPKTNPVRAAYDIYTGGTGNPHESWDLLATYFGILGLEEGSFQYGNGNRGGRIEIYPNATAGWNYSAIVPASRRQHFLSFKRSNATIAKKVDDLLGLVPAHKTYRF